MAVGTVKVAISVVEMLFVGVREMEEGHMRDGGAASTMLSGNVQMATLSALSVAVQLTVVVVDTMKRVTPESGHEIDITPDPSVADTQERYDTITSGRESESCVVYRKLDGQIMVGRVVSTTVMENVHVLFRPALSVAVQLAGLVPRSNVTGVMTETDGEQLMLAIPLPSVALAMGEKADTDSDGLPELGVPTKLLGHMMVG